MFIKKYVTKFFSVLKWAACNKVWSKPERKTVLIFDAVGSEVFLNYFGNDDVAILHVRHEQINMRVLSKCIMKGELSSTSYIHLFIESVSPTVCLTFIHSNPNFYELKNSHRDIVFISIQNGLCSDDVLRPFRSSPDKNFSADYIFSFGKSIGGELQKNIQSSVICAGSFKNNMLPVVNFKIKKRICFSSEFRNVEKLTVDNNVLSYKEFAEFPDKIVLSFLKKYCVKHGLQLVIAGCSSSKLEEEYFNRLLGDGFHFHPKRSMFDSYKLMDTSEVTVVIDCAMGYECLAKLYKTAMLTIRSHILNSVSRRFGWPENLPNVGPFWTNLPDENEFEKIMDYLLRVRQDDWEKVAKHYTKNLIDYDYGNTRFLDLMKQLGVSTKPHPSPISV